MSSIDLLLVCFPEDIVLYGVLTHNIRAMFLLIIMLSRGRTVNKLLTRIPRRFRNILRHRLTCSLESTPEPQGNPVVIVSINQSAIFLSAAEKCSINPKEESAYI
jgi:hypothetical protein